MTEVQIGSDMHTVTVKHDGGDLTSIIAKAKKLWQDTRPPTVGLGRATGFTSQIDPQHDYDRQQGSLRRPVRAEVRP